MLLEHITKYKDVIEIYMDESSNVLSQHHGHKPLECCRGIAIPLLHNLTQECAEDSREGCLLDVFWLHAL